MAQQLTISDLRNLADLSSNLLFAADSDTETFNLSLFTLFEYIEDRLGFLDTGGIEMYMGEVIPETHTELDGKTFDPLVFPKLGALFPTGELPDTRGMMLKHAPDGRAVLSFEAEAVKSHDHSASSSSEEHQHNSGTLQTGNTSPYDSSFFPMSSEGVNLRKVSEATGITGGSTDLGLGRNTATQSIYGSHFHAVIGTTAPDSHDHQITVNASGAAKNLVDNIAVKFIVKKA